MFALLLILLLHRSVTGQLTVGGWFFPVSVPPPDPKDNTVYDEEVGFPEVESANITHQAIKDYYEKDNTEKWNSQKPKLQPIYKKNIEAAVRRHHNDNDHTSTTATYDPLDISKSKRFLPNSGIPKFIPTPMGLGSLAPNEEPVITMSMTPIRNLNQPEEITLDVVNKSPDSGGEHESNEVSSTTEQVTSTKVPFVYEIPKTKSFDDPSFAVEREKDMVKLKRDVFRLRNEMNLVKALLNKLYKKNYRKQKDFLMKKNSAEATGTTRLSAVQADRNNSDWVVFRGKVHRKSQMNV